MQNGWLSSAWLALGLDALAVWNGRRIWPQDPEAPDPGPDPGPDPDPEAGGQSLWDPLDITIFI
jgi:hypothetical protein